MNAKLPTVSTLIATMGEALQETLGKSLGDAKIIGIQTGGLLVAEKLAEALGYQQEIGSLNISFYRDDFTRIGVHPQVTPSSLPFEVEDQTIILVDDVLYTGRTIRAALNEIFDYGRPARVILAILVDRHARELPICADVCGIKLTGDQKVTLVEIKSGEDLEIRIDG